MILFCKKLIRPWQALVLLSYWFKLCKDVHLVFYSEGSPRKKLDKSVHFKGPEIATLGQKTLK